MSDSTNDEIKDYYNKRRIDLMSDKTMKRYIKMMKNAKDDDSDAVKEIRNGVTDMYLTAFKLIDIEKKKTRERENEYVIL